MSVKYPWLPESLAKPLRRIRDSARISPVSSAVLPQRDWTGLKQAMKSYGALNALRPLNAALRRVASTTHRWQHEMEWQFAPNPEWYDTHMGQYYRWRSDRVSWIWDRGVFSAFAMKPSARVLDLCCGGGFFTYHFYSGRAHSVVGADFDQSALSHARKYNTADNITYVDCDIRKGLPEGPFDHVVWDGAIEHFTPEEIDATLRAIKAEMVPDALLTGYTIKEVGHLGLQNSTHEYEFSSKEDLARFFTPHFANVLTFETVYDERHNLHFFASDAPLPFDGSWPQSFRAS